MRDRETTYPLSELEYGLTEGEEKDQFLLMREIGIIAASGSSLEVRRAKRYLVALLDSENSHISHFAYSECSKLRLSPSEQKKFEEYEREKVFPLFEYREEREKFFPAA